MVERLILASAGVNPTMNRIAALLSWLALGAVLADGCATSGGDPLDPIVVSLPARWLEAYLIPSHSGSEAAFRHRTTFAASLA